jgi:hypothetical protein
MDRVAAKKPAVLVAIRLEPHPQYLTRSVAPAWSEYGWVGAKSVAGIRLSGNRPEAGHAGATSRSNGAAAHIFPNPGAPSLERIDRYALRDAAWALKKSERLSGSDIVDEALKRVV